MADEITTRTAFWGDLADLRDSLMQLGAFAETMLGRALNALVTQDFDLAEEVRRSDSVADSLDRQIEEDALRLLALQHPMASDLRTVIGAIRIAVDLERVADYAKDIAKAAKKLSTETYHWPLEDIPTMGDRCLEMLRLSLRAFTEHDVEAALNVVRMDRCVDDLFRQVRAQCMDHMRADEQYVDQATHFLLIARYLERVGDHIENVAERVLFVETGSLELRDGIR